MRFLTIFDCIACGALEDRPRLRTAESGRGRERQGTWKRLARRNAGWR